MISVLGHEEQQAQLRALVSRMPHALLLSGPKGVGKRLLAQVLAIRLLEDEALIAKGTHPDFQVVSLEEGKKDITALQMRNVTSELMLRPYLAKRKVVIIDDAEYLNLSASNAFLKTLEEPTDNTHIILVSHASHLLPETILSRCQIMHFAALSTTVLKEILIRFTKHPFEKYLQGTFAPLRLESVSDPRTLSFDKGLDEYLTQLFQRYERTGKWVEGFLAAPSHAGAMRLAAEVSKESDLEVFWNVLTSNLAQPLRKGEGAEALLDALDTIDLTKRRNLNPPLQISALLSRVVSGRIGE